MFVASLAYLVTKFLEQQKYATLRYSNFSTKEFLLHSKTFIRSVHFVFNIKALLKDNSQLLLKEHFVSGYAYGPS